MRTLSLDCSSPPACPRRSLATTVFATFVTAAVLATLALAPSPAQADELEDARKLARTSRWEEALEKFETLVDERGIEVAPEIIRLRRTLGDREALAAAWTRFSDERFASPALSTERAEDDRLAGRDDAARETLNAVIATEPSARAYCTFSEIELEAGELDASLANCEKALALHAEAPRPIDDLRHVGLCDARIARYRGEPARFRALVEEFYPAILQAEPSAWWAAFDAAALFFEKFDDSAGTRRLDLARAIAPRRPEFLLLQASREIESFRPTAALRTLEKLEATDPFPAESARLKADAELTLFHYLPAIEALQQALAIDPYDPRTLGRLHAIHATRGDFELSAPVENSAEIEAFVNERTPKCGLFYKTVGDTFDLLRKYPQASAAYSQSMKRMPASGELYASIGLMQMRMGEERDARETLEQAFAYDPYHVRVKNQLETLDQLEAYATLETDRFIIRFDRTQDELLARNVAYVLEHEVFPDVTRRLEYEPRRKTLIEIFSDGRGTSGHQWFSARMTGLPYLGTVGACAGRVIAIVSPRSLESSYSWARVLRHEFVHVVNLEQTEFNVPHWLTEGLAVWIEDLPRPPEWTAILSSRRDAKKLFDLESINAGFVRPDSPEDWTLAYCQAEIYVETLHDLRGTEGIRDLLESLRDGNSFRDALGAAVEMSLEEFEAATAYRIAETLAQTAVDPVRAPPTLDALTARFGQDPDDVQTLADLAEAYAVRGDYAKSTPFARAALAKVPHYPVAVAALARAAVAEGDDEDADEMLRAAQAALPRPDERLTTLRIAIALRNEDLEKTAELYRLALERWPDDPRWLRGAAKLFERVKATDELIPVLTRLASWEHDDSASADRLFELCRRTGREDEAERWAEVILRIRIDAFAAHAYVGKRAFARGDLARAEPALQTAYALDRTNPEIFPEMLELAIRDGDAPFADRLWRKLQYSDPDRDDLQELRARIDELP